ncbi:hypothetical protein KEM55_003303, partial [Ascosphaera atra]
MPRVAHNPRLSQGRASLASSRQKKQSLGASDPAPIKIPLNDDAEERSARLLSRQAQQNLQMDQIKAAAKTPMPARRRSMYSGAGTPQTPTGGSRRTSGVNPNSGGLEVSGNAVTPMKRVPILANFEEWMKMATDNKINANNSWNFALIDYFHDMSLLKEGDGVNFQKASCTLDGCVKIYTSRVDSVATETGKLLSGLADSNTGKKGRASEEDEEGDVEEEGEEGEDSGEKKKSKKKKKLDMELAVDPLFKKASADFDEGGAKGLLLNNLSIDGEGRIVFDSSDDAVDDPKQEPEEGNEDADKENQPTKPHYETVDVDISSLANKFFPDIDLLSEQTVCPSLKDFDLGGTNDSLDIPFLRAPEEWKNDAQSEAGAGFGEPSGIMLDDDMATGFDDDDDATITGFDMGGDAGFGQGGEAWAREAALEGGPQLIGVGD